MGVCARIPHLLRAWGGHQKSGGKKQLAAGNNSFVRRCRRQMDTWQEPAFWTDSDTNINSGDSFKMKTTKQKSTYGESAMQQVTVFLKAGDCTITDWLITKTTTTEIHRKKKIHPFVLFFHFACGFSPPNSGKVIKKLFYNAHNVFLRTLLIVLFSTYCRLDIVMFVTLQNI